MCTESWLCAVHASGPSVHLFTYSMLSHQSHKSGSAPDVITKIFQVKSLIRTSLKLTTIITKNENTVNNMFPSFYNKNNKVVKIAE